tara:strand:+ start:11332 stop:11934 length:603 start_codon:yes stop_codon:yes gene_type:complete
MTGAPVLKVDSVDGTEPVTTAEAKLYARVDIADDDTLIASLVTAARVMAESICRRDFIDRTYTWYMDDWPYSYTFNLPRNPVTLINNVKYYDTDAVLQTLASSVYTFDQYSIPQKLWLAPDQTWPNLDNDIRHKVQVNFSTVVSVPETVNTAIKMLVAHWYENREAVVIGSGTNPLPLAVESLLWSERIWEAEYAPVTER